MHDMEDMKFQTMHFPGKSASIIRYTDLWVRILVYDYEHIVFCILLMRSMAKGESIHYDGSSIHKEYDKHHIQHGQLLRNLTIR